MKGIKIALAIIFTILLAGCAQATGESVNPVTKARLAHTVRVEVLELARSAPGSRPYVPRLTLTDDRVLDRLVAALDTGLPKGLQVQCIPEYVLRFHLDDGTVQEFGYRCGRASFLRGEQAFWQGGDYRPPRAFDALLRKQLALHPPEPAQAAINLVDEAGLKEARALEIVRVHTRVQAEGATGADEVSIESLRKIQDPEVIGQFVASFDTHLGLTPRVACTPEVLLRFTLADGTLYDLEYGCGAGGPAILRGPQPYWREMDVRAPVTFADWIGT